MVPNSGLDRRRNPERDDFPWGNYPASKSASSLSLLAPVYIAQIWERRTETHATTRMDIDTV